MRAVDHIVGNGPAVFTQACKLGLEGIVSKRRDQAYRPGRGPGWLKIKCALRQEFVVGGFQLAEGRARTGIGALYCGHMDAAGKRCSSRGKVGTGFSDRASPSGCGASWTRSRRRGLPLRRRCPSRPSRRGAMWVRPRLVVEVRFANWTGDGRLRHASFEGMRPDKSPSDVHRERPAR